MSKSTPFDVDKYQEEAKELSRHAGQARSQLTPDWVDEQKPATYRLGETLIARIDRVAKEYGVLKGSLVKALLIHSLDRLHNGEWELPARVRSRVNL